MKRFVTTILAAVAVAACFDDPTSDLRGGPTAIRLNASTLFLEPAESVGVFAHLVDAQGNQVPGAVTFTSVDAAVATAGDVGATIPGDVEHSGWIKGIVAAGGATYVRATGGGITDSIYVVVVPPQFPGVFSATTAAVGDLLTVSASGVFSFDPASASVTIDGVPAWVLDATSSQITFVAHPTTDGVVEVGGMRVLGNISVGSLVASSALTITDATEPANDGPPGPTITMPAAGDSVVIYNSVDGDGAGNSASGDTDDFFVLTTTTADSVEITLEWPNGDIDIDLLPLTTGFACVPVVTCPGATGSDPEVVSARLAATTTYYILVELWDNHDAATPTPYRLIVKKIN